MINNEIVNQFFKNNLEDIESKIQKQYHEKVKKIIDKRKDERENIKMSIISELYYKQGFKDGIEYIIKILK